ncbi:MAG: hypothetical protein R3314_11575 [Longimicrobiales bacterium]|nr:hypothetical protein [Longimicrobiales bacterium]
MRRPTAVALTLLLAGCSSPPEDPPEERPRAPEPPGQADLCDGVANAYECATLVEPRRLADHDAAARSGDTLTIERPDGGERTFVDRGTAAATVKFAYAGYLSAIDQHVVSVHFYEGGEYRLVDGSSGRVTTVASWPVVSPNRGRVVVASDAGVAGYSPNLLQVWRVRPDGLVLEWAREPAWGAVDARWVDSTTVRFRKIVWEGCEALEGCPSDATLRLRDDEWSLEP